MARTHNVVFSQLASIAFNMLECGVDGSFVRSDVTRKCRESQLGESQVFLLVFLAFGRVHRVLEYIPGYAPAYRGKNNRTGCHWNNKAQYLVAPEGTLYESHTRILIYYFPLPSRSRFHQTSTFPFPGIIPTPRKSPLPHPTTTML